MPNLLITTDLMATSAAQGAAEQAGVELSAVAPGAAVEAADESTRFAAVDLTAKIADLPALIAGLRKASPDITLLAYGPHVHETRLQAASDAGFDEVISRGQFHRGMADYLRRYAGSEG